PDSAGRLIRSSLVLHPSFPLSVLLRQKTQSGANISTICMMNLLWRELSLGRPSVQASSGQVTHQKLAVHIRGSLIRCFLSGRNKPAFLAGDPSTPVPFARPGQRIIGRRGRRVGRDAGWQSLPEHVVSWREARPWSGATPSPPLSSGALNHRCSCACPE